MKKRIYVKRVKRKTLVEDALLTAREARRNIDPVLLDRVRQIISGAVEIYQSDEHKVMQVDKVPVDQKKNLSIVMKYLEMNPHNKALHHEIQSFLTQH